MNADPAVHIPPSMLVDGTTAFFTFTTLGYAPFVRNLHASLRRVDPELATKLIVFCDTAPTARALAQSGLFALDCGAVDLPEATEFDGPGFGRVVSYKFLLARLLLQQAETVWWCDGDIVARAPLLERVRPLLRRDDEDLVMQHEWPKDVLNTGFWIARRSPAVEAMLTDMTDYTATVDADDQAYFNETHADRPGLRITTLDYDEFRCGNRFYHSYLVRPPRCRLMHFNYSIGADTKQALMMGHGCWYLDEPRTWRLRARGQHARTVLVQRFPRVGRSLALARQTINRLRARVPLRTRS